MTTSQTRPSVPDSNRPRTIHSGNVTRFAYAQSLGWIALFWAALMMVGVVVVTYYADFVHHSSQRTRDDTLATLRLVPPAMGVIAIVGTFLVFTLPQIFQAVVADLSLRHGRRPELAVLLVLPLTVVIAWYSYDYLTPSNVGYLVEDVYEHGLTLERYATMFAIQTPISLFCVCYHHAVLHRTRKAWFILAVLIAVIGYGAMRGHEMAKTQNHLHKTGYWEKNRR